MSSTWRKTTARSYPTEAWLEGLLPESPEIRQHLAIIGGAASTRAVDLLATDLGLDCAGAVQVVTQHNGGRITPDRHKHRLTATEVEATVDAVANITSTAQVIAGYPPRVSLAGLRGKVALGRDGDGWYLPVGAEPTTHILKPTSPSTTAVFPNHTIVEHISMRVAALCGLEVARSTIQSFGGHRTIVVERFDRMLTQAGVIRRHQEDICQALGLMPTEKYERSGGPGVAAMGELLRRAAPDPTNAYRLLAALALNWAIAGSDAHGKNYSLVLEGPAVVLAPLYDLTSMLPYRGHLTPARLDLSMKGAARSFRVGGSDDPAVWVGTAAQLGLTPEDARDCLIHLVQRLPAAVTAAVGELPTELQCPEVARFVDDMTQHRLPACERVAVMLDAQVSRPSGIHR